MKKSLLTSAHSSGTPSNVAFMLRKDRNGFVKVIDLVADSPFLRVPKFKSGVGLSMVTLLTSTERLYKRSCPFSALIQTIERKKIANKVIIKAVFLT